MNALFDLLYAWSLILIGFLALILLEIFIKKADKYLGQFWD